MRTTRIFWPRWADSLHKYQLHALAAAFLEAAGPLALLGAQALHFSRTLFPNEQLQALAAMLEEPAEARLFAEYLTRAPQ